MDFMVSALCCTKNVSSQQIWGFSNSYWELKRQRPKLKKLKKLLMENPYEGPAIGHHEDEASEQRVLITVA